MFVADECKSLLFCKHDCWYGHAARHTRVPKCLENSYKHFLKSTVSFVYSQRHRDMLFLWRHSCTLWEMSFHYYKDGFFPLCSNSANACRCIMFHWSQGVSLKSWKLSMDCDGNCLRFIVFFTAHLDMFNLFCRAPSVIHGVSKNELQRGVLFRKERYPSKITQSSGLGHQHGTGRDVFDGKAQGLLVTGSGELNESLIMAHNWPPLYNQSNNAII